MPVPPTVSNLSDDDRRLLHLIASGYRNAQMARGLGITVPQLNVRLRSLYTRMGALDLARQARAYALAKAIRQYGLDAPEILRPAINKLTSGEVALPSELDVAILRRIAEGSSVANIVGRRPDADAIKLILGGLLADLEIAPYPTFCLVAAAIWAGLVSDIDFDRSFTPTDDDVDLFMHMASGRPTGDLAGQLGISIDAAKKRLQMLRRRINVRNEATAVAWAIQNGYLPMPEHDPDWLRAISQLQMEGLSRRQLAVADALIAGSDTLGIETTAAQYGPRAGAYYLTHQLYERLGVGSAAAAVALVLWAGRPLAADPEPIAPSALTNEETEILSLLLQGQPAKVMAKKLSGGIITVHAYNNRLAALYGRLGVHSAFAAVAVAAGGGFYHGKLPENEVQLVRTADLSAECRIRLACLAQGRSLSDALRTVTGKSYNQASEDSRLPAAIRHIPAIRVLAICIDQGLLSLSLPEGEVQFRTMAAGSPEPQTVPETTPADPDETLKTAYNRLGSLGATDKEVQSGEFVMTRDLGRLVDKHAADIVRLIREGYLTAPPGTQTTLDTVRAKTVSDANRLALASLAAGQTLEAVRGQLGEDPATFQRRRSMLCQRLRSRSIWEAVVVGLLAGIIT